MILFTIITSKYNYFDAEDITSKLVSRFSANTNMGSVASVPKDKKVVVVGGGYAGSSLALKLINAGADVTLIDPKSYFYHNIGTVRGAVDPSKYSSCYR